MARIDYHMADGTLLVDEREATTLADEIEFEHHFKQPSVVLSLYERRRIEHELAVAAAAGAGEQPPDPPTDSFAPTEWITFFSWCRFRRKGVPGVPDRFEDFVKAVDDWEFVADPADQVDDADENDGEAPAGVDATEAALIEAGSGLDPTDQGQRPTLRRISSSPASAGAAS